MSKACSSCVRQRTKTSSIESTTPRSCFKRTTSFMFCPWQMSRTNQKSWTRMDSGIATSVSLFLWHWFKTFCLVNIHLMSCSCGPCCCTVVRNVNWTWLNTTGPFVRGLWRVPWAQSLSILASRRWTLSPRSWELNWKKSKSNALIIDFR